MRERDRIINFYIILGVSFISTIQTIYKQPCSFVIGRLWTITGINKLDTYARYEKKRMQERAYAMFI